MGIFKKLVASVSVLVFLWVPSGVLAQKMDSTTTGAGESARVEKVDSFELFWPIVAGKVMGEQLYFLKSLKESLREFLIFSSLKKAYYNITLSEKRTVEAEKLFIEKKDYSNAKLTLNIAQEKREKALNLIQKASREGRYTADLKNTSHRSLEKQRALLAYIGTQAPEDQKGVIEENISRLNEALASLE